MHVQILFLLGGIPTHRLSMSRLLRRSLLPALLAGSALLLRDGRLLRCWWWLRQRWLRSFLTETDVVDPERLRRIGGVDVSFVKGSETDACAALVVLDAATLEVIHTSCRRVVLTAVRPWPA